MIYFDTQNISPYDFVFGKDIRIDTPKHKFRCTSHLHKT